MPTIADLYEADFPEVKNNRDNIIAVLVKESFSPDFERFATKMQRYIDDGLTIGVHFVRHLRFSSGTQYGKRHINKRN